MQNTDVEILSIGEELDLNFLKKSSAHFIQELREDTLQADIALVLQYLSRKNRLATASDKFEDKVD
jgi:hypothetical protein